MPKKLIVAHDGTELSFKIDCVNSYGQLVCVAWLNQEEQAILASFYYKHLQGYLCEGKGIKPYKILILDSDFGENGFWSIYGIRRYKIYFNICRTQDWNEISMANNNKIWRPNQ